MILDRRRVLRSSAIVGNGAALGRVAGPLSASALSPVGEIDVGGQVKVKRPGDTAYVHRQADDIFEMETTWTPLDAPPVVARQKEWLAAYFAAMEPHVMQQSYVNFPSRDLPDWKRAYYGDNLDRLSQVKLQYDPGEFFKFPQSVPLPDRVTART